MQGIRKAREETNRGGIGQNQRGKIEFGRVDIRDHTGEVGFFHGLLGGLTRGWLYKFLARITEIKYASTTTENNQDTDKTGLD